MLKPVETEEQFEQALSRVYELMQMDLQQNSPEFHELDLLSKAIEDYEIEHYPFGAKI